MPAIILKLVNIWYSGTNEPRHPVCNDSFTDTKNSGKFANVSTEKLWFQHTSITCR